ncbi:MAG: RNA polymerase sigma factor [Planctomycetota bacterium]
MTAREPAQPPRDGWIESLLEQHLPHLQAFVRLRAGRALLLNESAADLVQSVCGEVLEQARASKFESEADFRRWLFTTAHRKIVNRYKYHHAAKRDMRRRMSLSAADQKRLLDVYRSLHTPSQHAAAREAIERFEQAFLGLPDRYREVILLVRLVGLSARDVAQQWQTTEGAVWTLLSRALSRLAAELEKRERP